MGVFGSVFGSVFGAAFGSVGVAASRIGQLIPWSPTGGVRRSMAWRTSILKSWSGTEKRISLLEFPQESFEAEFELDDFAARYLRGKLFSGASGVFLLPDRFESILVTANVTASTVTVASTALADWAVVGHSVLLEDDEGNQHDTTISTSDATTFTLDDAVSGTFLANRTRISPIYSVYLADGQPTGYYRVNAGKWRMQARLIGVPETMGTGAAAFTTLDGLTVLDRQPVTPDMAQEQNQAGIALIDFGAVVEVNTGRTVADIGRSHAFWYRTAAERQWWKAFFYAARGQQVSFLVPTWLDDLTVHTQPNSTALIVYADDDRGDYVSYWEDSTAHLWLQFEMDDGTVLHRIIESAVDNLDGTNTLTLNASIDASGANPDISRISFMERCRLAGDSVTFEHGSSGLVTFPLAFTVVQQ